MAEVNFDSADVVIANHQLFVVLCEHLKLSQDQYNGLYVRAAQLVNQFNADQAPRVLNVLRNLNTHVADKI